MVIQSCEFKDIMYQKLLMVKDIPYDAIDINIHSQYRTITTH